MSEVGVGPGWTKLAAAVAEVVPPREVDALWVFPPLRHHQREWGTAIVARADGERRRIYTARYALAIKGKERGKFEATVEEVGSGPYEALSELVQEVRKRTDDEQPPIPVTPELWFPRTADAGDDATGEAADVTTEPAGTTDDGAAQPG